MAPKYCSPVELARMTGLCRATVYNMIGRGNLVTRKVGRRTLIDLDAATAWIDAQPSASVAAPKSLAA
jgi:excisionase family DNA binding protein